MEIVSVNQTAGTIGTDPQDQIALGLVPLGERGALDRPRVEDWRSETAREPLAAMYVAAEHGKRIPPAGRWRG